MFKMCINNIKKKKFYQHATLTNLSSVDNNIWYCAEIYVFLPKNDTIYCGLKIYKRILPFKTKLITNFLDEKRFI